jgi:hypothetical protein
VACFCTPATADFEEIMSFQTWAALAAMAVVPATASALQDHTPHASQGAASSGYESALANYKKFTEDEESPDARWREVNDEMGKLGGHAAHMKGSGETADAFAASGISATRRQKADSPVDHSKHH